MTHILSAVVLSAIAAATFSELVPAETAAAPEESAPVSQENAGDRKEHVFRLIECLGGRDFYPSFETYLNRTLETSAQVQRWSEGDEVGPVQSDAGTYSLDIKGSSLTEVLDQLSRQTRIRIGFLAVSPKEEAVITGPLQGDYTVEAALSALFRPMKGLASRWLDTDLVVVTSIAGYYLTADNESDRGLKVTELFEDPPHPNEEVTVTSWSSRNLSLELEPTTVFHRRHIEATGASTLAELLRYQSQTAFSRPAGYRASGAQYAELRGTGAETVLVLIDGLRAYPSANDLSNSAFDLNVVPIAAVERVEISADSTSLPHGTDAIGGVVNIVLKQRIDKPKADFRIGAADGGARQRQFTFNDGINGERGRAAIVLDYFESESLLGITRDRWRNQDYTRYNGSDYRSRFAAPGNIRSIDGRALPGLDSSYAAIRASAGSSTLELHQDELNLTSLYAQQAIVPEITRASVFLTGAMPVSNALLSGEALLVRRTSTFPFFSTPVSGIWGADHPQNPFDVPVVIETLLTGMPSPHNHVESELVRAVTAITGPIERWNYSLSLVSSEERTDAWVQNATDPAGLMQSLTATDLADALNVFSATPGAGAVPASVLAPKRVNQFSSGGDQLAASLNGPLMALPAGDASAHVGIERRRESAWFDSRVGEVNRDVAAAFAQLRIPVVHPSMHLPFMHDLSVSIGARRDDYSDVTAITRTQYGLTWRPREIVKVHATIGQSFRPPSLLDLYFPRVSTPIQILDPRRNEVVPVTVISGGNGHLRPTRGASSNFGISVGHQDTWRISVDRWRIEMRDRVSLVPVHVLLAHEAAVTDRVTRAIPSAADIAAGIPGPITSIDLSRANLGDLVTSGVDFSIQSRLQMPGGSSFSPRLDITHTDAFRYRDLPQEARLSDRVGIASEQGTITRDRAVASITYEAGGWRASIHGRHHSSYKDWDPAIGATTGRRIPPHTLWDINISRWVGKNLNLTLGATDLLNDAPPFSESHGPVGFDFSQRDLKGRTGYVLISGSL